MALPTRVFITGGSGFVGANLVRAEIAAGNEVHLLLRKEAQLWRLEDIADQFVAHRGDLASSTEVRRAIEASRPEIIYHLAAHGAYPSQKNRAAILATNLAGTVNLLEALADGALGSTRVVNVATGRAVAIRDVLSILCRLAGVEGQPVVDPALVRPDDPPEIVGDASRLRALTGWVPSIDLEQTLADLLASIGSA